MDYEIFGHLGGAIVAIALLPQVIKAIKTKSTKDISLLWNLILALGLLLWIIYGIADNLMPVKIFTTLELTLTITLLILKLKYK